MIIRITIISAAVGCGRLRSAAHHRLDSGRILYPMRIGIVSESIPMRVLSVVRGGTRVDKHGIRRPSLVYRLQIARPCNTRYEIPVHIR